MNCASVACSPIYNASAPRTFCRRNGGLGGLIVLAAFLGSCAMAHASLLAAAPAAPSAFVKSAYARQRVVPIATVPNGSIHVDGDLSEWGNLSQNSGIIDEVLDHTSGSLPDQMRAAAAFKFAHDDNALYFAVHVVDSSIAPSASQIYEGDAVELSVDFRPLTSSKEPQLGDGTLTAGTCQLLIAAPTSGELPPYMAVTHTSTPIGSFQYAAKRTTDGYTVEVALPYSCLPGLTRERLSQPFGFDVSIDDVDMLPEPAGKSPRITYAWSGSADAWDSGSVFGVADPGFQPSGLGSLIGTQPGVVPAAGDIGQSGNARLLVVGTVAAPDVVDAQATPAVAFLPDKSTGVPIALSPPHAEATTYPALGVTIRREWWPLPDLPTGRYVVRTSYPGVTLAQVTHLSLTRPETAAAPSPTGHRGTPFAPGTRFPDKRLATGQLVLPNGWHITPAGTAITLPGDMPQRILATADGRYLIVTTGGFHNQGVSVVDLVKRRVAHSYPLAQTYGGLCLDTIGADAAEATLFLSGGHASLSMDKATGVVTFQGGVLSSSWSDGLLTPPHRISFPAGSDTDCFVAGLAYGHDGSLYVVNINGDRIYRLTGQPLAVAATASLPYHPFDVTLSPDGKTLAVSDWGDQSVTLLDPATLSKTASYKVGSHPLALAYAPDGRLFVVCSGSNSVSVIAGGQVTETIKTSLDPRDLVGSTPDALAISKDGKRLYVGNADNNDITVVDISDPKESRVLGFIPTGWYPSALAISADGKKLYVGVGKGMHFSSNVDHTLNGDRGYIPTLLNGAVCVVNVPSPQRLAQYTRQVVANFPPAPASTAKSGYSDFQITATLHKIKHVIYIIRENRAYDQVMGDLGRGNGDPSLTLFGEQVTPNAHHLAREYVTMDNLYCNGEVSEDGHEWCDAAYATDFKERAWVNSYGSRDEPTSDDRLSESPAGYLWDDCARHGLTFRSYGEAATFTASRTSLVFTGEGSLKGHFNKEYGIKAWHVRDPELVKIFLRDYHAAEKSGQWPRFTVVWLPEDHIFGMGPGSYTPQAYVGSNDQALGQLVDAVSHSRFWKDTAIFVIEDDAQDGADHVDAHRTVGLVVSPYVRRDVVDSTLYTTASLVRTMEIILGLPPMTQFDERATPLYNSFMPSPVMTAYHDLPPRIDLMAKNPAGQGRLAVESAKLDFSGPDRVDPDTFNRLLWETLKPGVPMPAPVRSAQLIR